MSDCIVQYFFMKIKYNMAIIYIAFVHDLARLQSDKKTAPAFWQKLHIYSYGGIRGTRTLDLYDVSVAL